MKDASSFITAENSCAFALVQQGKAGDAVGELERIKQGLFQEFVQDSQQQTCLASALNLPDLHLAVLEGFANDLVTAIQEVCRGSIYLSPCISHAVVDAYLTKKDSPADPLSARERQVLQLVGEGRSTKEVAVQLGVSVKTAESHRARLMRKLDIHETASLVRYAIRRGLIQP